MPASTALADPTIIQGNAQKDCGPQTIHHKQGQKGLYYDLIISKSFCCRDRVGSLYEYEEMCHGFVGDRRTYSHCDERLLEPAGGCT